MRFLIPGKKPQGPSEDDFRNLSAAFSNCIWSTLFADNSANPCWPLDRNANQIVRGLWDQLIKERPVPGIAAYQPDQLSVEAMRHENHIMAVMRFPRLNGCACISAGLWCVGPLEQITPESLAKGPRSFFVMGEDVGRSGEAAIYDFTSGDLESYGMIPQADIGLFVETLVHRHIEGHSSLVVPKADPSMAEAMDQARAAVPYFIDILQNYAAVVSYSVKIRIEDEFGREYFWLENTQWQNGAFVGTIGNDPEHTRCVTYGQKVSVSPNDVYDWYYMWDGKMRGNYTLRASLPLMDADMAAKLSSILDEA